MTPFLRTLSKGCILGCGIAIGYFGTTLFAVTISGTINTFVAGDLVSASELNTNFASLRTAIESTREPPVGSIIAWHKDLGGVPSLPDGWVECDGKTINDPTSPLDGQIAPNLNGDLSGSNSPGLSGKYAMFLRGSSSSGTGQLDAFQGHSHRFNTVREGSGPDQYGFDWQSMQVSSFNDRVAEPITLGSHGSPRYGSETRPVNMSVVWILRIR